jgi:hypothetical protein
LDGSREQEVCQALVQLFEALPQKFHHLIFFHENLGVHDLIGQTPAVLDFSLQALATVLVS